MKENEAQHPATYTMLEAAQAANITKNTAKYRLRNAPETFTFMGKDGKIQVSAAGVEWLKESVKNQPQPPKTRTTQTTQEPVTAREPEETTGFSPDKPGENRTSKTAEEQLRTTENQLHQLMQSTIDELRERVKTQDAQIAQQARQIESLLSQNATLTDAVKTAQQLHAGTIQQGLLEAQEPQAHPAAAPETGHQPFGARLKKALHIITGKE